MSEHTERIGKSCLYATEVCKCPPSGQDISGRDILNSVQHNKMLGKWKELTGQRLASEIKAEMVAAVEAERIRKLTENVSQIRTGLKIGRR